MRFRSAAVAREQEISVVVPEGGGRRPLLIFLHGQHGDEDTSLYDEMFDALAEQGEDAPVVAFPDGGDGSYWHDRESGDWERYLREEVPAEVARVADVDLGRVAVGGISMGGFGALNLARRGGYCAAGGHSPAIFLDGLTPPGAFDDAEDFARHDLIAKAGELDGVKLWMDVGAKDSLRPGAEALADAAGVELHVWPGSHDLRYWRRHWDEYLAFYARALRDCVASKGDGTEEAQGESG